MPKLAKQATQTHNGPTGLFVSHPPVSETTDLASDAEGSDDPLAWETNAESDTGEDNSEQWEQQPRPITYEERLSKLAVRRENVAEKRRVAEVRSAEMWLGGHMDSQKCKKSGPYNVGGFSKWTIQEKSMKLRDDFRNGVLDISAAELDHQIEALKTQGSASQSSGKQQDLRPRTTSVSSDDNNGLLDDEALASHS
ncbi:hypothetical protein B0H10DRAFT_1946929 [Mycena sp. CBHHK59/15]|nr:hypothetical protein B0H10DRAFT_1946929 [Mycena sp. CBHHK59/15]